MISRIKRSFQRFIRITALCVLALVAQNVGIADGERRLEIDLDESRIEIVGKAWGFIPAVFAFDTFDAEISIDSERMEVRSARIDLPFKTLSSGDERKDKRIHQWLEVKQFPKGHFIVTGLQAGEQKRTAVGILNLHGRENEMRFEHTISGIDDAVTLEGEATIDYRDWGLPPLRVLIFTVDRELQLRIRLKGNLVDESSKESDR